MGTRVKNKIGEKLKRSEFIERNNSLSVEYAGALPERKTVIEEELYNLNHNSFRPWKLGLKNRIDDFKQEMYLRIRQALAGFNPNRGCFVSYLDWQIKKAWQIETVIYKKSLCNTALDGHDREVEEEFKDPLLWKSLKSAASVDEYRIMEKVILEEKSVPEICREMGLTDHRVNDLRTAGFNKLRAAKLEEVTQGALGLKNCVDKWLTIGEFCRLIGWTRAYGYKVLRGKSTWKIKEGHILRAPLVRVHYLCIDGKMVYPQIIRA